jgi:hypothetical protein
MSELCEPRKLVGLNRKLKMKNLFIFILLNVSAQAQIIHETMLEAIKAIEAVPSVSFVGKAGERSEWQITSAVWRELSAFPFASASRSEPIYRAETQRVARKHLQWVLTALKGLGLPETPYSVGLVWNAGYGTIARRSLKSRHVSYAQRCENFYCSLP